MGDEEVAAPVFYSALKPWTSSCSNSAYCGGKDQKGGFRAASFIFVLAKFENMAFVSNMVSLVLYFNLQMHFDVPGSANTLTNLMGSTFLLSLVGGFISDTLLNRYSTALIFGFLEVLSLVLMTIQAHSPSLQPSACGKSSCVKGGIAVLFYASLCLMALGAGGVKGALPALGADQFDARDPKEAKGLASYFNYLLLSSTLGGAIGVTVIVWVSSNEGWWRGFLICTVVTFVGFVFMAAGKPFYRLQAPVTVPIIRIAQVIFVAVKNRRLSPPENANELYEISDKDSFSLEEKISHTPQFRCLDKAAILEQDVEDTNIKWTPWTVCSVTQVEEVKILTRMLPIIASTILMNTCLAQLQTFSVQQGYRMNRYLGSFEVPASSIPVIPLLFMSILIPVYEFLFVPFARKFTGHASGITQLQRVGIGLVLSAVSMAVAALVEVKRRRQSLKNPLQPISLFWLSFQYGIFGIADMFTLVGLLEFFYKEAPVCMKSLSTSFTWISLSIGYFLSTVFVNIINSVTKRVAPSRRGWLYGQDLDQDHLDLFYWFLSILSCLNFLNYLYWASWYKYKTEDQSKAVESSMASTPVSGLPLLKEETANGSVPSEEEEEKETDDEEEEEKESKKGGKVGVENDKLATKISTPLPLPLPKSSDDNINNTKSTGAAAIAANGEEEEGDHDRSGQMGNKD
ncbi:protein NRT1/ PTR FAMILY 4.5-like [Diospyros lotus]|uniref:protein NRT1/ PTR FAMILY 4.5-like n=1 Tax=Diospyros lotus TaxID=55363 RepID=UPI00224CD9E7|nr:protein NRT1/ PTR FAMILY 4.5-like [Diospyros lotus]